MLLLLPKNEKFFSRFYFYFCYPPAQHVVKESNDIKEAMKFLQQCDMVRIEDILPFFDDFITIDHFRDAICSSLQVILNRNLFENTY